MEPIEYIKTEKLHLKRLKQLAKDIYKDVLQLNVEICVTGEPVAVEDVEKLQFKKISKGFDWGGLYTSAWFKLFGTLPQDFEAQNVVARVDIGGEGLLFVDGKPKQGLSNVASYIDYVQPSQGKSVIDLGKVCGGQKIELLIDGGYNGWFNNLIGKGKFKFAKICTFNQALHAFYYDYLTLVYAKIAAEGQRKQTIEQKLLKSFVALGSGTVAEIDAARKILEGELYAEEAKDGFVFSAIGHAHLDLAWLWPVRETRRKSARTFANQIVNSDRYPSYIFGASQPEQFLYIKNRFPSQFEELKQKVEEGKFELQGAMWVECDTNLSGGEALVRQLLYGKRFFREEFQKEMEICWLPDVFGYNGNLPQILKKSGVPYFMTIKLSWNEHNRFPHRTFNWEGIDGSSVLVHMAPDDTYNSAGCPMCLKHALDNFTEKDKLNEALMIFGIGDGGAGPGEGHIEMLLRQQKIKDAPKIRFEQAIDFFKRLDKKKQLLKTHSGELYLEKHQGTYTSQARSKRFNRKIEYLLNEVESLMSFAATKGMEYDHKLLDEVWKEFLLYQFHDILPGSSINRVYTESLERYAVLENLLKQKRSEILDKLKGKSNQNYAYNTSPFDFNGFLKYEGKWHHLSAAPYSTGCLTEVNTNFELQFSENSIENDLIKVVFNQDGEIVSLVDKKTGEEFCKEYLNRLNLFNDPKLYYNAWDIKIDYRKKAPKTLKAYKHETFVDGASVVRRNFYKHGKTEIAQDLKLTFGNPCLQIDTVCDFCEKHKMLRAEFLPNVNFDSVKCDIQMGTIERSAKNQTSVEKAQFEICAHKYVDVSNDQKGMAVLNDCKYGHYVKEGVVSLNLLRSPTFPDKDADKCRHEFSYSIFPHSSSYSIEVLKQAYQLNKPPLVVGDVEILPLVTVDNPTVLIETIKKAEDENAIVVRLFECMGKSTCCNIKANFEAKQTHEVNLTEENQQPISLKDLQFSPFEIKTLKFTI